MLSQSTATLLLAALLPSTALAHMAMQHPTVYGFEKGYKNVEPLANMEFDQWWFHGEVNNAPKYKEIFHIPAGGEVNVELSCSKDFSSWGGKKGGNNPCPSDIPSMHAGNPVKDSQLRGCALAIAYKSDAKAVQPEDFVVFSVNHKCVKDLNTKFQVPAEMPKCPNDKCICAWFWQGQESANEMYMNGFDCRVTNPGTKQIAQGKPPVLCKGDPSKCVSGPKQPLYWANKRSNIKFNGNYAEKPAYNDMWGFKDGRQPVFQDQVRRRRAVRYSASKK